jgi:hypothetical protein
LNLSVENKEREKEDNMCNRWRMWKTGRRNEKEENRKSLEEEERKKMEEKIKRLHKRRRRR